MRPDAGRVYGITGLPCSGKSRLAQLLVGEGVIDVDRIGHQLLNNKEIAASITRSFGKEVLTEGTISRSALGRLVFADSAELKKLEAILHPPMVEKVRELVRKRATAVAIDAALLFHMELHTLCESIILVEANFQLRLGRARSRGWNTEELQRRDRFLRDEITRAEDCADLRIDNNGSLGELKTHMSRIRKS